MYVLPNKKGLTLIEVMVALLITLVLFLALMQSALLSINTNVTNELRNEAVSVAEMKMRELKNLSFTDSQLDAGTTTVPTIPVETRQVRNFTTTFTPTITVTPIPFLNPDIKQIEVKVAWTDPSGEAIEHIISSMKKK